MGLMPRRNYTQWPSEGRNFHVHMKPLLVRNHLKGVFFFFPLPPASFSSCRLCSLLLFYGVCVGMGVCKCLWGGVPVLTDVDQPTIWQPDTCPLETLSPSRALASRYVVFISSRQAGGWIEWLELQVFGEEVDVPYGSGIVLCGTRLCLHVSLIEIGSLSSRWRKERCHDSSWYRKSPGDFPV